jgi:biopolymer transport protein ExbB/TolQ
VVNILAQVGGSAEAPTAFDLIAHGTRVTYAVLGATALASLMSWIIIFWKFAQFRRLKRQGYRFGEAMQHAQRLEDAHRVIVRLPTAGFSVPASIFSASCVRAH